MAHLPVLVDFWSVSADPHQSLEEVWKDLTQDYLNMAIITPHSIKQDLNDGSTLTYVKMEREQKILLKYDHN